jgi:hypothetical protein
MLGLLQRMRLNLPHRKSRSSLGSISSSGNSRRASNQQVGEGAAPLSLDGAAVHDGRQTQQQQQQQASGRPNSGSSVASAPSPDAMQQPVGASWDAVCTAVAEPGPASKGTTAARLAATLDNFTQSMAEMQALILELPTLQLHDAQELLSPPPQHAPAGAVSPAPVAAVQQRLQQEVLAKLLDLQATIVSHSTGDTTTGLLGECGWCWCSELGVGCCVAACHAMPCVWAPCKARFCCPDGCSAPLVTVCCNRWRTSV